MRNKEKADNRYLVKLGVLLLSLATGGFMIMYPIVTYSLQDGVPDALRAGTIGGVFLLIPLISIWFIVKNDKIEKGDNND